MNWFSTIKFSFAMVFNPISTIKAVKQNRGIIKAYPSWLLILLLPVIRIIYLFTVNYPFTKTDIYNVNILVEIATTALPIILFILASFLITTINDGESLFSEILILGSYCGIPYLVFILPVAGLSWIISGPMASLYDSIHFIVILWCVILTFLVTKETNDYSFGKTVFIYLLIIVSMLLLLATILLVYILLAQLFSFFGGLFTEIGYIVN